MAGWLARNRPAAATVAAIFPDGPQRYFETVFNDDYCRQHHLLDVAPANEPLTIRHPADTVVDSWTRCTTVVNPTEAVR